MTKWKKPRTLKIGALTYKIRYMKPGKSNDLTSGDFGYISQEKQLIVIDNAVSNQMILLTLIHEILHGIDYVVLTNRSVPTKEHFTTIVAELLLQALQSAKLLPTVPDDLSHRNHDKQKGKK